jgi:hypothetical protein
LDGNFTAKMGEIDERFEEATEISEKTFSIVDQ